MYIHAYIHTNVYTEPLGVFHMKSMELTPKSSYDDSGDVCAMIQHAEELLRNAYRMHWSSEGARSILGNGSHVFVSSPILDLLQALHVPSLRRLCSEFSPYAVRQLCDMSCRLHSEYQHVLESPGMDVIANARSSFDKTHSTDALHTYYHLAYAAKGLVAVYKLSPLTNFDPNRDTFDPASGLLSEDQLQHLTTLLSDASPNSLFTASTLIVCSPIPLFYVDPMYKEYSDLSPECAGMSYSTAETIYLLELLAGWLEADPSREVVIVCSGLSVGFDSFIEVRCSDSGPYGRPTTTRPHSVHTGERTPSRDVMFINADKNDSSNRDTNTHKGAQLEDSEGRNPEVTRPASRGNAHGDSRPSSRGGMKRSNSPLSSQQIPSRYIRQVNLHKDAYIKVYDHIDGWLFLSHSDYIH